MTQEDAMNMNDEQAILILESMRDMMLDMHGCPISGAYFALSKAIDALKKHKESVLKTENNPVSEKDVIYRQDAIETVMEFMPSLTTPDGTGQFDREIFEAQEMFVDIGQALKKLPSAQPERKKGKYIKGQNGEYYCSVCRRIDEKYSVARYCWYCGADMRGEQE